MAVWAIGDLHLSFGTPDKEMDIFGPEWKAHHEKIQSSWDSLITEEDLVLIPGDISWAMREEEAIPDLEWIHKRPGTKVMIKGNHDYWWGSATKVRKILPKSIHIISNDAFLFQDIAVGGARLWDSPQYNFSQYIEKKEAPKKMKEELFSLDENNRIFEREAHRLLLSVTAMNKDARVKIVMTHYPPISADLQDSVISQILANEHIDHVVFGHLHSLKKGQKLFGKKGNVSYHLVSADWLDFVPVRIL